MAILSTATSLKRVPAAVDVEYRIDGSQVQRLSLLPHAHRIEKYLGTWVRKTPEKLFLAERLEARWRQVNYRDALMAVRNIVGNFLFRSRSIDRPTAILSRSSIITRYLRMVQRMGISAAPISPASS